MKILAWLLLLVVIVAGVVVLQITLTNTITESRDDTRADINAAKDEIRLLREAVLAGQVRDAALGSAAETALTKADKLEEKVDRVAAEVKRPRKIELVIPTPKPPMQTLPTPKR